MDLRRRFALAWLVLSAGPLPLRLSAQEPDPLAPGVRVRVRMPDTLRQVSSPGPGPRMLELRGTLISATPDTLVLAVPGTAGALAISRSRVRTLAVSRGVPSRATSAVLNVPEGVLAGFTIGIAATADRSGIEWETVGRWTALGAAVGLVYGAVWPAERWRRVSARVTAGAGPAPGGMALGARVAF